MDRELVIRTESQRFADVLADTPSDARVPTCPDWTADDLLWHLTEVQLFWAGVLATSALTEKQVEAVETAKPARPTQRDQTLALRATATESLLTQLARHSDPEPLWSWFEPDQTVGFTRRMQTYEATMHRVDAELAAGLPISQIEAEVAAGAVAHGIEAMWSWMPESAAYERLAIAEFIAADTGDRWLAELGRWRGSSQSGKPIEGPRAIRAESGTPTVTVGAPVVDLALWAWKRGGSAEVSGDRDGLAALDAVMSQGMP